MATQPLGWFKKVIQKPDDFQGLKFRTVGIAIDLFQGMGAVVSPLPAEEIVSAIDRGVLDAAEFNNESSDRLLGFADVSKICVLQSYHQNAEQLEIVFNKAKFNALPDAMKAIVENAVEAASADMSWKSIDRYSKDYIELQAGSESASTRRRTRFSRSSSRSMIRWRQGRRRTIGSSGKSPNRRRPSRRARSGGTSTPT
jgi:TRAP-type mannitol/chloroaromatic compound transport system substrate-binding protein